MISTLAKSLGKKWQTVPKVIKDHYEFDDYGQEKIVEGSMDEIGHNWYGWIFVTAGRFIKTLVPYNGKDIPTIVYTYELQKKGLIWRRDLDFGTKGRVIFRSRMHSPKEGIIDEYIGYGLSVRTKMSADDKSITYTVLSYGVHLFGLRIPFAPILVMGGGYIKEEAIDQTNFAISFELQHRLFGKTFGYNGKYKLKSGIRS